MAGDGMRFRRAKKNWRKAEVEELRELVNSKTNEELCEHFGVTKVMLQNAMQKYKIKRDTSKVSKQKKDRMSGENNPNWKGGISKDGAHYQRVQRARYPERKAARDAVYRALKDGRLIKAELCEDCGERPAVHGHHEDYSKPLEVEWLCRHCHRQREDGLH